MKGRLEVKSLGCSLVIDNSRFFRMDQNVPLIVPQVNSEAIKTMKQKISGSLFQSTIEDISLFIQIETNYIWTDSEQFHQKLQELLHGEESIVTVDAMKELIESYLETIFHTMSIVIPKKIMWYLVKNSSNIITSQLFELCQMNHLEELLEEDPGVAQKRKSCQALQTKLIEAKRLLETIQKSS